MVDGGGTSDFVHDPDKWKRWAEQYNERLKNPPSVHEHIQFFIDLAQARLLVALREQDEQAQGEMRAMIREAETALQHFEAGDIERALIAYDRMHEHRAKYNLPLQWNIEQSNKAKKPRNRKSGPRTTMLTSFIDEIGSNKSKDILAKLDNLRDPSSADYGTAMQYEVWFDGELYHFELDGQQHATRKQIQDTLSKIRNKKD